MSHITSPRLQTPYYSRWFATYSGTPTLITPHSEMSHVTPTNKPRHIWIIAPKTLTSKDSFAICKRLIWMRVNDLFVPHSSAWRDSMAHINESHQFIFMNWVILMNHSRRRSNLQNIWISRSISFPNRSFEWRGLRLLNWKIGWNFGDSRESVFDMYGEWVKTG